MSLTTEAKPPLKGMGPLALELSEAKLSSNRTDPLALEISKAKPSIFARYFDIDSDRIWPNGTLQLADGLFGRGIEQVRKVTMNPKGVHTNYSYLLEFMGKPGMVLYGEPFGFGSGSIQSSHGQISIFYCEGKVMVNRVTIKREPSIKTLRESGVSLQGNLRINNAIIRGGKIAER